MIDSDAEYALGLRDVAGTNAKERAMSEMKQTESRLVRQLKAKSSEVAKKRDELRTLVDEFSHILESAKDAGDEMDAAINELDCAIDTLSQFV